MNIFLNIHSSFVSFDSSIFIGKKSKGGNSSYAGILSNWILSPIMPKVAVMYHLPFSRSGFLIISVRSLPYTGLFTPADLSRMSNIGVDTFLIGESLMRQQDVAAATHALLEKPADAVRSA